MRNRVASWNQSHDAGVAGHIGNYADAESIPAGVELIHTSGTPGLRPCCCCRTRSG